MNASNKKTLWLAVANVAILVTGQFSPPAACADSGNNPDSISADGKTEDSEISIAIINALSSERTKGNLKGFNLDLQVNSGIVELSGSVSTEEQVKVLLSTAKGTPGVKKIVNRISIKPPSKANPKVDNGKILRELAEARKLIRQLDQRLERLEAEVSSVRTNGQPRSGYPVYQRVPYIYPSHSWPTYGTPYPTPPGWTPAKLEWEDGNWKIHPTTRRSAQVERVPTNISDDSE